MELWIQLDTRGFHEMAAMDFPIFLVCLPSSMNARYHLLSLFLLFILTGSTVMDIGSFSYIVVTLLTGKKELFAAPFMQLA